MDALARTIAIEPEGADRVKRRPEAKGSRLRRRADNGERGGRPSAERPMPSPGDVMSSVHHAFQAILLLGIVAALVPLLIWAFHDTERRLTQWRSTQQRLR
jgi:hypothetical protein